MLQNSRCLVVILMGVSGAGKTTVGKLLAKDLGWKFYDSDYFHPQTNIDKMQRGVALTDEDRSLWLARLRTLISERLQTNQPAVIACSALKYAYRRQLTVDADAVRFMYLRGTYEQVCQRLKKREDHFMPVELLKSQFAILEEPKDGLALDISQEPGALVVQIKKDLIVDR